MVHLLYSGVGSKFYNMKSNKMNLHKFLHKITDLMSFKENSSTAKDSKMSSIHSANITEIHEVPIQIITRPLASALDEEKVKSLMESLNDPVKRKNVPPIDVLWVQGRLGGNYYFSFGGCHRFEAFKRLKHETIPCKILKTTTEDIRLYLGSSMPDLK